MFIRIYSYLLLFVLCLGYVKVFVYIIGGGLLENIFRVFFEKFGVDLDV